MDEIGSYVLPECSFSNLVNSAFSSCCGSTLNHKGSTSLGVSSGKRGLDALIENVIFLTRYVSIYNLEGRFFKKNLRRQMFQEDNGQLIFILKKVVVCGISLQPNQTRNLKMDLCSLSFKACKMANPIKTSILFLN